MIDSGSVERAAERFRAPEGSFDRLVRRRDRKRRNQRIGTFVLVAVIATAGLLAVSEIRSDPVPADRTPAPAPVRNGEIVMVEGLFWRKDVNPELVAVDPQTGAVRRLVTCDEECSLSYEAWSPDGRELLYSSGGTLYVLDIASGTSGAITPGRSGNGIFSPDGEQIVYDAARPTTPSRFVRIGRDGRGAGELAPLSGLNAEWYHWSPDGRSIAYFEHGSFTFGGGSIGLVELGPEPQARTLVTFPELEGSEACSPSIPLSCAHSFAMSPVDGRIAYAVNDAKTGTDTVRVVDPDDGAVTLLARWPATMFGSRPLNPWRPSRLAWSPDGSRIAFAVGCQIWSIASDGTDRELIKELGSCAATPDRLSWAPDGTELAFVELGRDINGVLHDVTLTLLTIDGGPIRRLAQLEADDAVEIQPFAWRPIPIPQQP